MKHNNMDKAYIVWVCKPDGYAESRHIKAANSEEVKNIATKDGSRIISTIWPLEYHKGMKFYND